MSAGDSPSDARKWRLIASVTEEETASEFFYGSGVRRSLAQAPRWLKRISVLDGAEVEVRQPLLMLAVEKGDSVNWKQLRGQLLFLSFVYAERFTVCIFCWYRREDRFRCALTTLSPRVFLSGYRSEHEMKTQKEAREAQTQETLKERVVESNRRVRLQSGNTLVNCCRSGSGSGSGSGWLAARTPDFCVQTPSETSEHPHTTLALGEMDDGEPSAEEKITSTHLGKMVNYLQLLVELCPHRQPAGVRTFGFVTNLRYVIFLSVSYEADGCVTRRTGALSMTDAWPWLMGLLNADARRLQLSALEHIGEWTIEGGGSSSGSRTPIAVESVLGVGSSGNVLRVADSRFLKFARMESRSASASAASVAEVNKEIRVLRKLRGVDAVPAALVPPNGSLLSRAVAKAAASSASAVESKAAAKRAAQATKAARKLSGDSEFDPRSCFPQIYAACHGAFLASPIVDTLLQRGQPGRTSLLFPALRNASPCRVVLLLLQTWTRGCSRFRSCDAAWRRSATCARCAWS